MGVDLRRFRQDRAEFRRQLRGGLEAQARSFAREFRRQLSLANPVRTGRSSASWNAAVGESDQTFRPFSFRAVEGEGIAEFRVQSGRERLESFELGQTILVSNYTQNEQGVFYLQFVEFGTPRIAPRRFVEGVYLRFREASELASFRRAA